MRRILFFLLCIAALVAGCKDDESFGTGLTDILTFPSDTIHLDTLFNMVPSATYSFWVYNQSSDGIRISQVRLEQGEESPYRVNVDGSFLNPIATDIEVRKGDSIRVFVEVTTPEYHEPEPQKVSDRLLFLLESGVEQHINLCTYSLDVLKMDSLLISRDTTIVSAKPLLISGGVRIAKGSTLTLKDTQLFFHDGAGVVVNGTLRAEGCLFRGDRLDRMFNYLPYDRVSGQWKGFQFTSSSKDNVVRNCEIRSSYDGVLCDSASVVTLERTKIHNSRGYGLKAKKATVTLSYCQLTNSLNDCLSVDGGEVTVDHCTLAQFYPFSANRGAAIRFTNSGDLRLTCSFTLATGYEEDVVFGEENKKKDKQFDYHFSDCLLRTKAVDDTTHLNRILWETPKDSIQGKKHFRTVDEDKLFYDFRLDSISPAYQRGIGCI